MKWMKTVGYRIFYALQINVFTPSLRWTIASKLCEFIFDCDLGVAVQLQRWHPPAPLPLQPVQPQLQPVQPEPAQV